MTIAASLLLIISALSLEETKTFVIQKQTQ
jgi:hypothetical protein